MNRGRPKKIVHDNMTMRSIALEKHSRGEPLTYEETALAIWDPATSSKPMTAMGICKIEQKALAKLKVAMAKFGIKSIDDMFEHKHCQMAKVNVV